MRVIADDIRGADLVCLEEVDRGCSRSGGIDEAALIAQSGGFPYYEYIKAIDLGEGEYGCAILSRFPLTDFRVVALPSDKYEKRACGIARAVDGVPFNIYCTHLSYENAEVRAGQFAFLKTLIEAPFILCGDFNVASVNEFSVLPGDCANTPDSPLPTFIATGEPIDNIVTSGKISSRGVRDGHSDHRILEAEVSLNG